MKEATELISVNGIVGSVDIQHNAVRWPLMGLLEQINEQLIDRVDLTGDFLIPFVALSAPTLVNSMERLSVPLASQGLALGRLLALP